MTHHEHSPARVAAILAVALYAACASTPRAGHHPRALDRIEADAPGDTPGVVLERRWLREADPLIFFSGEHAPPNRRVPGAHADTEPLDLALGPGERALQIGASHPHTLDAFALSARVRGTSGVFLRHATPAGVDLEVGSDEAGFFALIGGVRVDSRVALDATAWHQVAVIVDGPEASLVVDGMLVRSEPLRARPELGAGGRLEAHVRRGAIDEVALFDDAPHPTLFLRSWLARPLPDKEAFRTVAPSAHGHVEGVALDPTGAFLATWGYSVVKVWSLEEGLLMYTLPIDFELVDDLEWSPDGAFFAVSALGTVRIFERVQGDLVDTIGGHSQLAWSPNGEHLAVNGEAGCALWSTRTQELVVTLDEEGSEAKRSDALSWSHDSALLSATNDGATTVWRVEDGSELGSFYSGDRARPIHARWHPTTRHLAVPSPEGHVAIWSQADGEWTWAMESPAGRAWRMQWSPSGDMMAIHSYWTIDLWDVEGRRFVDELDCLGVSDDPDARTLETSMSSFAWSPDGRRLLTTYRDGQACLWDARTGALSHRLEGDGSDIKHGFWTHDSAFVYTGDAFNELTKWSASTGEPVASLETHQRSTLESELSSLEGSEDRAPLGAHRQRLWNAQGTHVLSMRESGVDVWSVGSGELVGRLDAHSASLTSASWGPRGERIVTSAREPTAYVWSALSGDLVHTLSGHTGEVTMALWSPDGAEVVTTSMDGTARIWSGAKTRSLLGGHAGAVLGAAYDPSGARLVTWGADRRVRIWDAESGALLVTMEAAAPVISEVVWDTDGAHVAVTSHWPGDYGAGRVHVRDARTGARAFDLLDGARGPRFVVYSPDGEHLSGPVSDSALFWRARGGAPNYGIYRAHDRPVLDLAWRPDSERVATASMDRTVKVWPVGSEVDTPLHVLRGHTDDVTRVEWSPDGTRLVTSSADESSRIWAGEGYQTHTALLASGVVSAPTGHFAGPEHLDLDAIHGVKGGQVYSLEQLAPIYNRPDLVLPRLGTQDPRHMEHLRALWARRLHWLGLDTEQVARQARTEAPRTRIVSARRAGPSVELVVHHADRIGLVSERLRVNGVPLLTSPSARALATRRAARTHTIALTPGRNVIEISAFNSRGVESKRRTVVFEHAAPNTRPRLYFVGVGASDYEDPGIQDLRYAHEDIHDMDAWFTAHHEASGFAEYVPVVLTQRHATRAGLERARARLAQAREEDMVVVMVSGHGTYSTSSPPRYFFLTHDTTLSALESTAISLEELEDLLVSTKARRRLMLMDTCQSGDTLAAQQAPRTAPGAPGQGTLPRAFSLTVSSQASSRPRAWLFERRFINRDLAWRTGAMVLSSSQGFESSWEDPAWRNGAFTEALLQGLGGSGDADQDGGVSLRELDAFVRRRVPDLTRGRQHPSLDRDNPWLEVSFTTTPSP